MTSPIRSIVFTGIIIASIWTAASTAQAQEPSAKAPVTEKAVAKDKAAASDSVTLADVQKAADQLAMAVQEAVRKATEDPAVKVAALKVAKNAVTAAQVVITQQAESLQTVLDALAREIAQATDKQQAKAKSH
jgi:hypothetical protein